jgi:hypothetical protein
MCCPIVIELICSSIVLAAAHRVELIGVADIIAEHEFLGHHEFREGDSRRGRVRRKKRR